MKFMQWLVLGLALAAGTAAAQSFPDRSKPLKIIVPSGVGSTADLLARAYGRAITEVAGGWPVVVENRSGAEGLIGVQAAKAAPPDGYTIMLTSASTQVLNPLLMKDLPYDPVADFVPLTGVSTSGLVMWVTASAPFRTAGEFFAAARANPGKYTYGSNVTIGRLAAEMVEHFGNLKLLQVQYKTLPEVLTGVASGQIDMAFSTLTSGDGVYKAGRVRPLAVSGRRRLPDLPDVPTMREAGLADYDVQSWTGLYAPARTPPPAVAALRDILSRAGKTATVTDLLAKFGTQPLELVGDELAAFQRADYEKVGKVLRATSAAK